MTAYYVDPVNGSNANAGTSPTAAWLTCAYALTQIANGSSAAHESGDTVYLMTGTYTEGDIGNATKRGATWRTYNGPVVIDATSYPTAFNPYSYTQIFGSVETGLITITNTTDGIRGLSSAQALRIAGVVFVGLSGYAVSFWGGADGDAWIKRCMVHNHDGGTVLLPSTVTGNAVAVESLIVFDDRLGASPVATIGHLTTTTSGNRVEHVTAYAAGGFAASGTLLRNVNGPVRNCSVTGARGAAIFSSDTAIESCHYFDSSATAEFAGTATPSGTAVDDPEFIDADAGDFRITATSPLFEAGAAATTAAYYDETGVGTPPHIGAMPSGAGVASAAAESRQSVLVTFTGSPASEDVGAPTDWAVALSEGFTGAEVSVVAAVVVTATTVRLTLHSALTPGAAYVVTALASGMSPASATFGVSAALLGAPDTALPGPYVRAFLQAIGHQANVLNGFPTSRLARDLDVADTALVQESTIGFAGPAAVWVDNQRIAFKGVAGGQLTGASGLARTRVIPAGTPVTLAVDALRSGDYAAPLSGFLDRPFSRVEALLRATSSALASGDDLDMIARFLGLPRPSGFPELYWREVLLSVGLGERAGAGIYEAIYWVLKPYAVEVEVSRDPAYPTLIVATSGAPFVQSHAGAWVRIDGLTYYVQGPASVGGTFLELSPRPSYYWSGADWSGLAAADTVTAEVLAYTLEEATPGPTGASPHTDGPGRPSVLLVRVSETITVAPPTYLQPDATTPRPVGQPDGGYVLPDEATEGDPVGGPFPLYLGGGVVYQPVAEILSRCLPPGFRVEFVAG